MENQVKRTIENAMERGVTLGIAGRLTKIMVPESLCVMV